MVLSDISTIYDCPHSTAPDEGEGFPLIRTPNVGKGRLVLEGVHRVCKAIYDTRNKRAIPRENDIIFAREAPAGNAAVILKGQNVCLGQRTVLIRPDAALVDSHYLTYYILAPQQQEKLLGFSHGATVGHVNIPDLAKLPIVLPPLKAQREIASIVEVYDDLIEANNKRIKVLEQMAETLYKEWFVRFRFPGHETAEFKNGIPKDWHIGSVKDTFHIFDTIRIPLSSLERDAMKKVYPYYGAAEMLDYVEDYLFDGIYLLLGEDGSVITPDGRPMLQYVWGKFWVNNHAHVLQGKEPFSTEYIYLMLKNTDVTGIVTGSAQPKISQGRLFKKKTIIPSTTVIEQFNDLIFPIFGSIRLVTEQNKNLSRQRDLLLPRLMSGKLEV